MNPLIYAAILLGVAAVAITAYAVLSAPEGAEDDEGFHSKSPAPEGQAESKDHPEDSTIPPFPSSP
jgi:hypothetical protein